MACRAMEARMTLPHVSHRWRALAAIAGTSGALPVAPPSYDSEPPLEDAQTSDYGVVTSLCYSF